MSRPAVVWVWSFGVCAMAVLTLALIPTVPFTPTTGWDKSNHVLAFAVLAWLGSRAFAPKVARVLLGLHANRTRHCEAAQPTWQSMSAGLAAARVLFGVPRWIATSLRASQ